ncbi:hypothetical protein [Variovorax paradoxus]|uniref:Lipoprotein n=1 Tax=Variovorax paradoxus TaxID=34073 RepID=A0A6I6HLV0_VARPD|nr:hypothetical protein [Variovorax paradoxus]QGW83921.1 hypothetical protein GOQ09_21095 [Variovorax paradoxus]
MKKLIKAFSLGILLVSGSLLYGCGVVRGVTANDLDWNPPKFIADQCPDLSGDYTFTITRLSNGGYATDLLKTYAGSIYMLWRTAKIDPGTGRPRQPLTIDDLPDFQSYYLEVALKKEEENRINNVLHIEQTKDKFIQGGITKTRTVTRLGTEMSGCFDGALILRTLEINGGQDFVPRTVSYGEFEIRKDAGGGLKVAQRKRHRSISSSTGLLGDRKELPSVIRIYPPVKF